MKCFIPAGLLAATLLLGCSDEREEAPPAGDAGATIDVAADREGGSSPADVSVDTPRDAGPIDLFDVFPLPDAGCPNCLRDRCGSQINACINNPACGQGLLCTIQNCALDGGISTTNPAALLCVLNCFGGDQATAFMAIGSLTCVTMTCGSVCIPEAGGGVFDVRPPNPDANDASVDHEPDATAPDATAPDATDNDVATPDAEPDTQDHDATPDATAPDADATSPDDADGGTTGDGAADAPETSEGDVNDASDANADSATPDDVATD